MIHVDFDNDFKCLLMSLLADIMINNNMYCQGLDMIKLQINYID